jgi:hypothetical protein
MALLYKLRRSREKNEHNARGNSVKRLRERSIHIIKNILFKSNQEKNQPAVVVSDKSHLLFV